MGINYDIHFFFFFFQNDAGSVWWGSQRIWGALPFLCPCLEAGLQITIILTGWLLSSKPREAALRAGTHVQMNPA